MFDSDRFGRFAPVGNLSLYLMLCRATEVCLWFHALYQGHEPGDARIALITLISAFPKLPRARDFPFGTLTLDELNRMAAHLRCIGLSKELALPHAIIVMVLNYYPHLTYIKYILSPLLAAAPLLCWCRLSVRGRMAVTVRPMRPHRLPRLQPRVSASPAVAA